MFEGIFSGKKVLVLGHTGFKGSWLTLWLNQLGAQVVGISNGIPTKPAHYDILGLSDLCQDKNLDIRDYAALSAAFREVRPDFIFHLAAQSLVGKSFECPVETFQINTLGTVNILEAIREHPDPITAVLITSDKCYENTEMVYGYRETDSLGGKDPYSASKAAAEIAISAYVRTLLSEQRDSKRIGIGRAGNVIGGGDWSEGRLIPDIVEAWAERKILNVRSLAATRPWQYVLEPLSGYLCLAARLSKSSDYFGEPFNFGPRSEDVATVGEIVDKCAAYLSSFERKLDKPDVSLVNKEAGLLKLSCEKAQQMLEWRSVFRLDEALEQTMAWYKAFHSLEPDMAQVSRAAIEKYSEAAYERNSWWAR